jgi:hypothetical protein
MTFRIGTNVRLAAPQMPRDLSGLVLWLRADLGVTKDGGNKVSNWADQSGSSNDAAQGTAANQPTYVASSINSLPTISFDGSASPNNDILITPNVDMTASPGVTCFIVAKDTTTTASVVLEKGPNANTNPGFGAYVNDNTTSALNNGWYSGSSVKAFKSSTTFPLTTPVIWCNTIDTASIGENEAGQFVNGAAIALSSYAGGTLETSGGFGNSPFYIGSRSTNVAPLVGEIAEIIVYNRLLSYQERRKIEEYLSKRYAISLETNLLKSVSPLALWLRSDMGLTVTAAPSVSQDLSSASWIKLNSTVDSATVFRDTNDLGTPTLHRVYTTNGSTGLRPGTATIYFKAKALTISSLLCYISPAQYFILDLITGTKSSLSAGITVNVTNIGTNTWSIEAICTNINSDPSFQILTAVGGVYNYAGDGTGTLEVWDFSIEQDPAVITWADQSGNAYDFTQGSSIRQALLIDDSGVPAVYMKDTGIAEYYSRAYTAGLNTNAMTQFFVYKAYAASTYQSLGVCRSPSGADALDLYLNNSTNIYPTLAGPTLSQITSGIGLRRIYYVTSSASGGSGTVGFDGQTIKTDTGQAHAGVTTGHYIGTRSDLFTKTNGYVYEVIQFSKALNESDKAVILEYLGNRYAVDVEFSPAKFASIAAWYDANLGVTALAPITSADTTGWTPTSCTAVGQTITDSNDGVPTMHYIGLASTGMQTGGPDVIINCEFKAGTRNWVRIQAGSVPAANDNFVYVNLTDGSYGSIGATTSNVYVAQMSGGWYKVTFKGYVANVLFFYIAIAEANDDITYQGDGTGTIYMRNFSAYQPVVSQLNDQSTNGYHLSHSTLTNKPLLVDGYINNLSAILFDGVNDTLYNAVSNIWPTDTETLFFVGAPVNGSASEWISCGHGGGDVRDHFYGSTENQFKRWSSGPAVNIPPGGAVVTYYASGVNEEIWLNGVSGGTSAARPASTNRNLYLASARSDGLLFQRSYYFCTAIIYSRQLTSAEKAQLESYLGKRWLITGY